MDVTRQDLNQLSAENIKDLLLQHDVVVKKGSGKSGRVTKSDRIDAFLQFQKQNPDYFKGNINTDNMAYFKSYSLLPNDLIYEVMTHLDLSELANLCQTNSLSPYCQDQKLWQQLYQKHFGSLKITNESFYEQFKLAYQLKYLKNHGVLI